MDSQSLLAAELRRIRKLMLILALGWTTACAIALGWSVAQERSEGHLAALESARAQSTKDVIYRRWNSLHGGVYVPVTDTTPPNPYLNTHDEREIVTPSGKRLTLINPSYMTRQVHALGAEDDVAEARVVALHPINAANSPDAWERSALEALHAGGREISTVERRNGESYLRVMRPLVTEPSCVGCHEEQAYKAGEVRGGISTAVSLEPYRALAAPHILGVTVGHGVLWLMGLGLLGLGGDRLGQHIVARHEADAALRETSHQLHEAVKAGRVGLWDWDLETNRVRYSPEWKQQIGFDDHEIGDDFEEWRGRVHPDDLPDTMARIERAIAEGDPKYAVEFRFRHKDGAYRWILAHSSVATDESGRPVRVRGSHIDVTDRKETENQLRTSKERFERIAQHSRTIAWEVDANGLYTYVCSAMATVLGYTPDEIIGKMHFYDLHPEEDREAFKEAAFAVFARKASFRNVENRALTKDGRVVWLLTNGLPILDEAGKLTGYSGNDTDITERKQATQALLESEARYRSLAQHFPGGALFIIGPDWRYLAADGQGLGQAGLRGEDIVGRTVREVFPELWDILEVQVGRALRGERVYYEVDYRGRRYANQAILVNADDGRYPENVLIVTLDITEQYQAQAALREQEHYLSTILETTADGFFVLDDKGNFVSANSAYCSMTGYRREELLQMHVTDVEADEEPGEVAENMARIRRAGVTFFERRHRRKDGTLLYIDNAVTHIDIRGGIFVCFVRDMAERIQAQEAQAKLQEQLSHAQKMESVGRLAGGIAHDFNNMLNVIMGNADLATDYVPEEHPARENIEEIQAAAERSADLTRQLLAFARKQTIAPEVLNINDAIESMLKILRRLIGEDIDLLWKPASIEAHVKVDPAQVDQMLANLVVNARDAIDGVGKVTIETAEVTFNEAYCATHAGFIPGDYVMFAVSDDGRGMDAATKARIFEPFFTTKGVGEGTGMGLATVFGIVKQNEGFVNVYSEPGQGSTFKVYLPICFPEDCEAKGKARAGQELPTGTETILLVEDEASFLSLGSKMLQRMGYNVLAAGGPKEALQHAEAHDGDIDLVITDVIMPEMNGRELAHQLLRRHPRLKILFMSGYTANVIAHRNVLDEGVHFMAKPFSQEELARQVREALES